MATHNGKDKIDSAIESVFNQTYDNWKMIICDDGSTDGTYNYLKGKYKEKRIIILKNNEKKGLAYSLNKCIKECNDCEFIARMDDDDFSYPNRFERQIDYLKNHSKISFVSSNIEIYNGQKIIGTKKLKEFPTKNDLIWNSPFVHPSIIFRRDDLIKSELYRVAPETTRGQDYDLFMRMYSLGLFGANIQEFLFRYTDNNQTRKKRTLKIRLGECKVRFVGYKKMGILLYAFPFVIKPLLSYLKDVFMLKRRL